MKFSFHRKTTTSIPCAIAVFEDKKASKKPLGKGKSELLDLHLKKKTFSGKSGESIMTYLQSGSQLQKIVLIGLGKSKDWNEHQSRNAGANIVRALSEKKVKKVSIVIPEEVQEYLQAFAEGLVMGHFNPAIHKTGKELKSLEDSRLSEIQLIADSWDKELEAAVDKGLTIAQVVNYTRNIVNCGPKQMSTEQFVNEVTSTAKKNGFRLTDLTKKKLERMGMGGILAVNQGSMEPAHMLILEHNHQLDENPIVICGKGIIFDTGGVSLKPSTHMHEMQLDMAGAAAVLGTFKLLKKLGIKRKVVGIMPVTDNSVGSNAYRPSDIITTFSGKTVEIMNTDAEGRMILSDALYYGATEFKPRYMIDMATLTGACVVALGFRTAGLYGNDDKLRDLLMDASRRSDEALCPIPITDADEKAMKGKLADLTNLDMSSRYAGASRAAAFLKNFVDKAKWAHIDLAGPAFTKEPKAYESPMATGYGIRLMIDFLEHL